MENFSGGADEIFIGLALGTEMNAVARQVVFGHHMVVQIGDIFCGDTCRFYGNFLGLVRFDGFVLIAAAAKQGQGHRCQ